MLYSKFLKLFLDDQSMTYYNLISYLFKFCGYVITFCLSVVWTTFERPKKICYKKWLGPDWEPTYEGMGTVIMNHQSYVD